MTPIHRRAIFATILLAASSLATGAAKAAPGLGAEVYSADVYKGELELEARYGQLTGGPAAGSDGLTFELGYTPLANFRFEGFAEFARDAGGPRKADAVGIEAINHLGRIAGLDIASYAEAAVGLNGRPNSIEGKLLVERKAGRFDARVNLIAEKLLAAGMPTQFGYAASADFRVLPRLTLGAQAYGDLGTVTAFAPRAEHFLGPVAKTRIDHLGGHTLKIEAGYLFALDKALSAANGQVHLLIELEI